MANEPRSQAPSMGATTRTGQPPGLYVLFFTEMWERFSYYGMRTLLVLFMVAGVTNGGLGLNDQRATAIYGLYTAGVYLAALPGGWVADRLIGPRQAIWIGGLIIAAGHFTLAIPQTETFYLGLILLVLGTGLLKPNISSLVGQLYPEGGARRDAGFTIFYMGINIGAAIGPFVCSFLGETLNWHYGFAAAGVGMVLGLIQYRVFGKSLGHTGQQPPSHRTDVKSWSILGVVLATIFLVVALAMTGIITINPVILAHSTSFIILGLAFLYFTYLLVLGNLSPNEKRHLYGIILLFVCFVLICAGLEQAGSTLNLFAKRFTVRTIGLFNFEIPAGWFQSLPGTLVIILAPVMASLWVFLARRNRDLSIPVKFFFGLLFVGAGFLVIALAAKLATGSHKVLPVWLVATYFLHTVGELCTSPVGLSSITKLAPQRLVGQMMGIWFMAASLGNLLAGLAAGVVSTDSIETMPSSYFMLVLIAWGAAALLLIFIRPLKKLMVEN